MFEVLVVMAVVGFGVFQWMKTQEQQSAEKRVVRIPVTINRKSSRRAR
jgi:nicotinamide riboside transporter PnuC